MKKLLLLLFLVFSLKIVSGQIVAWDFNGANGNETTSNATTNHANLATSVLSRGNISGSSAMNTFSGFGFTANQTLAVAITDAKYMQFIIKPVQGFKVSLTSLDANFRKSSTGPTTFTWQYSLDNFTTPGIAVGAEISVPLSTPGAAQAQIDLAAISALQDVTSATTITFRLYGYSGSSSGGTFGFGNLTGNDLQVAGSVTSDSPPIFTTTYPKIDNLTSTGFDLFSNINEPGTTYYVVLADGAPAPTALQVSEGKDASGTLAANSGFIAIANTDTDYSKSITGLTANVDYDVYVVAKDAVDNLQTVPVKLNATIFTTLPILLRTFTGKATDQTIVLNWSTASETNNRGFEILRSTNGKSFSTIGSVNGAGTSTSTKYYSFTDKNPFAGKNYYQLIQYDFDGNTTASSIVAADSKIVNSKLTIHTSSSDLKITISSPNQTKGLIQVFELSGRKLTETGVNVNLGFTNVGLPLNLQTGIYFIRYITENETVSQKFIW